MKMPPLMYLRRIVPGDHLERPYKHALPFLLVHRQEFFDCTCVTLDKLLCTSAAAIWADTQNKILHTQHHPRFR